LTSPRLRLTHVFNILWIADDAQRGPGSVLALGWILTGAIYIVLLFTSSELHHLVPTSWSIFPHA
jgi:hypothetical protein